ncbi:hypothetical protein D6825_03040, partial [Candidatus Woesearchaeota archaeon]
MKPLILYNSLWPNDITLNILKHSKLKLKLLLCDLYSKDKKNYAIYSPYKLKYQKIIKTLTRKTDTINLVEYKHIKKTLDNEKPSLIISNLYYMPATW